MNLLEHYIINVESVNEFENDKDYVVVRMIVNCYGIVGPTEKIFHKDEWKEAQTKGYYMV